MGSVDDWHCVILAGGDAPPEIVQTTGARSKAAVPILGITSLGRVLRSSREVGFASICVVAEEDVLRGVSLREGERAASPGATNIESALNGLEGLPDHVPTFLTPCDVPLLEGEHIERFLRRVDAWRDASKDGGTWFAAGLADEGAVRERFPGVGYRYLKFREGRFAAGSLYASTPYSVRSAARLLGVGSARRKSAVSIVLAMGAFSVVRYLLGLATLAEAERKVGALLGGECLLLTGCDPETTMDFDTLEELLEIERLLGASESEAGH